MHPDHQLQRRLTEGVAGLQERQAHDLLLQLYRDHLLTLEDSMADMFDAPAFPSLTPDQLLEALRSTHGLLAGRPVTALEEAHVRLNYYTSQGYSILGLCQRALALLQECHDVPSILPKDMDPRIRALLSEAEEHGILPRT